MKRRLLGWLLKRWLAGEQSSKAALEPGCEVNRVKKIWLKIGHLLIINSARKHYHDNVQGFGLKPFSLAKIYRLFFFEFSTFSLSVFFVMMARAEFELLFDSTPQDSLVAAEPKRLAESALFLSRKVALLGVSFALLSSCCSLNSLKKAVTCSSTTL